MSSPLQKRRLAFAVYVGTCCAAILLAPTIVGALEPTLATKPAAQGPGTTETASAGTSAPQAVDAARRTFEECDRNGDGYLDKSEAGGVPGLSANFERADLNQDGRLDRGEFAKAVALLDSQKK